MYFELGRFSISLSNEWGFDFHCTNCCYFWLWLGPLTIQIVR